MHFFGQSNFTELALHTYRLLYYVRNSSHDDTFNGMISTADGTEYQVVNGIAQP